MAKFIKGDVVVIPFPFSDLSGNKRRPALVLADLPGDDIILCQITSQPSVHGSSIQIKATDFIEGFLPVDSFIKPERIFTADKNIIIRKAGAINPETIAKVKEILLGIFK